GPGRSIRHSFPTRRSSDLAARLLAAADRGARFRILLDALDVTDGVRLLDALDAHPRIEVRLFNPFRFRARSLLAKASQFLFEARSAEHTSELQSRENLVCR